MLIDSFFFNALLAWITTIMLFLQREKIHSQQERRYTLSRFWFPRYSPHTRLLHHRLNSRLPWGAGTKVSVLHCLPFWKKQDIYSSVSAILHPYHDSPLILVELRQGRATGSTSRGLEGPWRGKHLAEGSALVFLNPENTHVNEARRRAGAYSAQYWGGN